jgi:hypothetical protein
MSAPNHRPREVTVAVAAFGAALLIGFAILQFGWRVPRVALATLALVGALIVGVARRQNWARWALLVLTVVSLIMTWPLLSVQLTYGVLVPLATITQLVLEAVGFTLLFRPAAGRWYRHRPPGVAASAT